MRTRVAAIAIVVPLLLLGCIGTGPTTREDLTNSEGNTAITIVTKSSLRYAFARRHYHIKKDSLVGSGEQIAAGGRKVHFEGAIALDDIDTVFSQGTSLGSSVFAAIGVGFLLCIVLLLSGAIPLFK